MILLLIVLVHKGCSRSLQRNHYKSMLTPYSCSPRCLFFNLF